MSIVIGRVVRCRWAQTATAAVLAGTAAFAGAVPAAASPINLVDCNVNHNALQPAIDGAPKRLDAARGRTSHKGAFHMTTNSSSSV